MYKSQNPCYTRARTQWGGGALGSKSSKSGVKSQAFTLAEVLITLGIIGVVAAMTMPSLINNYQQKQYEAKYAKAKNVMANGINLMMAQNNVFDIADLPIVSCKDDACRDAELAKVFKNYQGGVDASTLPQEYKKNESTTLSQSINDMFFSPAYAKISIRPAADDVMGFKWTNPDYIFRVQDGIVFGIKVESTRMAEEMVDYAAQGLNKADLGNLDRSDRCKDVCLAVFVDINGSKSPNTIGKDLYAFRLSEKNKFTDITSNLSVETDKTTGGGLLQ